MTDPAALATALETEAEQILISVLPRTVAKRLVECLVSAACLRVGHAMTESPSANGTP